MADYWQVLFFSLVGGLFSLVGGVLLLSRKKSAENLAKIATPFAAGALLAAAFFDLLPESIEQISGSTASRYVLGGILLFFLLEHFLHWFHHHHEHQEKQMRVTAPLIIAGDTIHNFLDGIAIGAAFLINVPTGIVAAVAVAAHEIPQEIGDFGLLLKAGVKRQKVININIMSALMSTVGALLTFWLGNQSSLPLGELLALTAGMFVYIAASDLIPTIHENTAKKKKGQLAAILLITGILLVGVTTEIAHEYIDTSHEHVETTKQHADHGPAESDGHGHSHGAVQNIGDHALLPGLTIEIKEDPVDGFNLLATTTGFTFNARSSGRAAVDGEGHAHIYLNGVKIARLYGQAFHLADAKPGDTLRVTLNANDHRELAHDGRSIAAELVIGEQSQARDPFSGTNTSQPH